MTLIEYECIKTQIVTDAIELLEAGYPLDGDTIKELGTIGVDHNEFIERFQISTDC